MGRTVLIVDDHATFRATASALLTSEGLTVVGTSADGASALRDAARLRPQVILLDIQLPDIDGFAVAAAMSTWPSAPGVVLVSSHDPAVYGDRIEAAQVRGFIAKSALSAAAISAVMA